MIVYSASTSKPSKTEDEDVKPSQEELGTVIAFEVSDWACEEFQVDFQASNGPEASAKKEKKKKKQKEDEEPAAVEESAAAAAEDAGGSHKKKKKRKSEAMEVD